MRIQHNIAALNSYRNLTGNNSSVSKNLEKLSSGYRINRAGDDAAGLAISEKMRAQITGLKTAQKNSNDGISLVQTAEGALTEVHSMLNRMVELADQSANGTYQDTTDRQNLQKEVESLISEIDRISEGTDFNGIKLLDGSLGGYSLSGCTVMKNGYYGAVDNGIQSIQINGGNLKSGASISGVTVHLNAATGGGTVATLAGSTITAKSSSGATLTAGTDFKFEKIGENKLNTEIGGTVMFKAVALTDKGEELNGVTITVTFDGASITGGTAAWKDKAGSTTTAVAIGTIKGTEARNLQVGDTAESFNKLGVRVSKMDARSLGIDEVDISTADGASKAINKIKNAINFVSSTRGDLGAIQNRLEHTINNLNVTSENMTSAESRIRDVDMAEEMMGYTKNNILVQASQAMLAQANQLPQGVLQLLQ